MQARCWLCIVLQQSLMLRSVAVAAAAATISSASSSDTTTCGRLPAVAGFSCYPGFCASDRHAAPPPQCGPTLAGLQLNGSLPSRLGQAKAWCDTNASCAGFAIDPGLASCEFFSDANFTRAAQPNPQWTAYWRGSRQPAPAPRPIPPAPPPPPWHSLFPAGPCKTNSSCSLNGNCVAGRCVCTASWTGAHCQHLVLKPLPAGASGYGVSPNVSSWGGSIYHNDSDPASLFHLYVTEETGGKGLKSWITNSQIIHAVSDNALGPYKKRDVVSAPPTTNPQILYDHDSGTFLLFHIRGSGTFQLFTSASVDGPWHTTSFAVGACNNPTAAFHPNRSLFLLCHDSTFSLHRLDPKGAEPAWRARTAAAPPIPTLVTRGPGADPRSNPGNCEDPFIFFDRYARFHVLAHCYTHDQYSLGDQNVFCSAHGFSETGEAATWTWVGGEDAPYNWTSPTASPPGVRSFSTKERPWALLGGVGRAVDEFRVLVNGVSPIGYDHGVAGSDWTYTLISPVGSSVGSSG